MENQTIGIKLADGSFYPILEEGQAASMFLELTTVRDDQQTVQLDLYRSPDATMEQAEYVDTLLIEHLIPRPSQQPSISLKIDLDENNTLSASIEDKESGESSSLTVSLLNLEASRLADTPDFVLSDESSSRFEFADPVDIPVDISELSEDVLHNTPSDDELTPPAPASIDYHFSDIPVLEDVPRQNSVLDEPALYDQALTDTEPFIKHDISLSEEEFPDFKDIQVSDSNSEEIQIQEEDSSIFDFGEEFKDESFDDSIPTPSFSFSDLYEEDSMEVQEKTSSKALIPVIICIICAVISVAALVIMLLIGPLRIKDFFTKPSQKDTAVTEQIVPEPLKTEPVVEEPLQVIPLEVEEVIEPEEVFTQSIVEEPAKENEIVKVETEVVVPEVPAAPAVQEKGVSYKIKWGDTLWDIADAYYKNPWLYPKIAKFNGIKNPDVIISGTWITIPSK